ncbi:MAG: MFS transporter [Clostridiales bacterium]
MEKIFKKSYHSNIYKLYFIRLFFHMHFISAVLVTFFTEWGRISFSKVLFINAWFMLWNFILEIPTGTVSDFISRKISIILGSIFGIIAILVMLSYPHFYIFLIAEILFAVSYTLNSGADTALCYDSLIEIGKEKDSKKILGNLDSFNLVGIMIGAAFGGFIAKFFGLSAPLLFQITPLIFAIILSITLKEPIKRGSANSKNYLDILKEGIKVFKNNNAIKILTLDMVFVNSLVWLIIWFYQVILKELKVDIMYFGVVHLLMCLAQILVIKSSSRLEKFFKSKRIVLFLGGFIAGIGFIMIILFKNPIVVSFFIIIVAGFGLSRNPLFSNYMNKYIESDNRATVLSVVSMFRTLMIFFINLIAGILSDWSINKTLLIVGITLIVFSFISKIREDHLID